MEILPYLYLFSIDIYALTGNVLQSYFPPKQVKNICYTSVHINLLQKSLRI
jgi:hypothetical protein